MPTASANLSPDRSATALAGVAGVAAACFLILPRASPLVLLGFLAAAALMAARLPAVLPRPRELPLPVLSLAGFGLWAALSAVWAVDRPEAIGKSVLLLVLGAAVAWSWSAAAESRMEALRHACWAVLAGFAAGLAYLAVEEIGGHSLKRLLFLLLPFIRLSDKHMQVDGDEVAVAAYVSNRNVAAAMLALWPMLLIAWAVVDRRLRAAAMVALSALAAVTIALSVHETSILALAASLPIFAIAWRWPRLALGLVATGWLAATLLVVPLASWGYHKAELHRASWLPHSAKHRIVLWGYTADAYWQRPLAGIGASSTKRADAMRGPETQVVPGTKFQWRAGTHAHNAYLQTWYELGAIGALLLCAFGLALIGAVSRIPRRALPYAAATLTTSIVMAATSWGMWQPWFMGAFAVSAVLLGLGVKAAEPDWLRPRER